MTPRRYYYIITDIIIYLVLFALLLTALASFHIISHNKLIPKAYYYVEVQRKTYPPINKDTEVDNLIKLYDTNFIYIEKNFKEEYRNANSIPLLRMVILRKGLKDTDFNEYILAFAHEITHIKFATADETWVEYKSITMLYESGNEYFMTLAWNKTADIIDGCYDNRGYDCGAYLLEYFGL